MHFPVLNSNISTKSGCFHVQTEVILLEGSFFVDVSIYRDGIVVYHKSLSSHSVADVSSTSVLMHEKAVAFVNSNHENLKNLIL